jgi:hypothetical protein
MEDKLEAARGRNLPGVTAERRRGARAPHPQMAGRLSMVISGSCRP